MAQSAMVAEPVPLRTDRDGTIRVAGSRLTLDTIIAAYDAGASAEEIVQSFPSVSLSDVYAVLTYYLRHPAEVADYLRRRHDEAEAIRREIEPRFGGQGLKERLQARLAK